MLIIYFGSKWVVSILRITDICNIKWVLFQVRASAVFALATLLDIGFDSFKDGVGGDEECDDDEKTRAEIIVIIKSLLNIVSDGSPLVRAEVAVGMW